MAAASPKVDIQAEIAAATKVLSPAVKRLTKALAKFDPKCMPVGALADLLYELRQVAKLPVALADPFNDVLAPTIKLIEEYFIQTLMVGESSGVQGKRSRVQITDPVIPVADDWSKIYAYIVKKKAFELLNRALNKAAIQERWDAKQQIPGIKPFRIKKVSCTKLGGKDFRG